MALREILTMQRVKPGLWFCMAAVALGLGAAVAKGDESVYERALPSQAWILSPMGGDKIESGSGVLVDRGRRLMLTAYHVVAEREEVLVFFPARNERGELISEPKHYARGQAKLAVLGHVVSKDPKRDLAVIRLESVPAGARAATIAAQGIKTGEEVIAIGNSGASDGVLWRYIDGRVRQVYRKEISYDTKQKVDARLVEMTLPSNGGDSGGPVLNTRGELVGITIASDPREVAVHYAVDLAEILAVVNLTPKPVPTRFVGEAFEPAPAPAPVAGGGPSTAPAPAPAPVVASVPSARVSNFHLDKDTVVNGQAGIMAHFDLEIDNAEGRPCSVVALIYDDFSRRIRSRVEAYREVGDILGASRQVTPRFVDAVFTNVRLFIPYAAIEGSAPSDQTRFRCGVNVLDVNGNRWILNVPASDTFSMDWKAARN
jgi:hypothetical protein